MTNRLISSPFEDKLPPFPMQHRICESPTRCLHLPMVLYILIFQISVDLAFPTISPIIFMFFNCIILNEVRDGLLLHPDLGDIDYCENSDVPLFYWSLVFLLSGRMNTDTNNNKWC